MNLRGVIGWLVFLSFLVVGLTAWVVAARPQSSQIALAVRPLTPLPTAALSDQAFKDLQNRHIYGTQPVTPLPANPTRTDPFH